MPAYVITGDQVIPYITPPKRLPKGSLAVASLRDLEQSGLSNARLTAIWNGLPDTDPIAKFKDRRSAVRRLWAALSKLPTKASTARRNPVRRSDTCRVVGAPTQGSKQAQLIALLSRPDGATLDDLTAATGWQRHSIRGAIAGTLKKRLGLTITAERIGGTRRYRLSDSAASARSPQ
jgi:hypothetical protein